MILVMLLVLIGTAVAGVYALYRKKFKYWAERGFPYEKPSFPFGNTQGMSISRSIGEMFRDLYEKNKDKPVVGVWLLFKPSLLIRDPELIKTIFVRDFMSFHDRGIAVNEKEDPLSAHLFSIAGSKWRNLRVKLTPTFTSGKMKLMFPILVECSKQFQEVLEGPASRGEVVEVKDYAARFTTDIISLVAFGLDTDSLHHPDAEFRAYGRKIFEPTLKDILTGICQSMIPSLYTFFRMRSINKDVTEFFMRAFKESIEYREKNNVRRNDFLDLLIQLKNKGRLDDADSDGTTGTKFSFEEAAAQAFVFFIAGFETSSTTMQFIMYEMAKNPDIQQKAREEINAVLAKHNGEVTYESIAEMDYLGRVIDETLRMYPPVPFLQREANKDFPIPDTNLVIPKGTQVMIDCWGLQHDPEYYPNPEKFDPDRFTEEEKSKRHHYTYLPFGEGPRNCIGSRFGLMQTRVGMMTLIKNFKISVAKETQIPLKYDPKSFILTPKDGMNLKLEKIINE